MIIPTLTYTTLAEYVDAGGDTRGLSQDTLSFYNIVGYIFGLYPGTRVSKKVLHVILPYLLELKNSVAIQFFLIYDLDLISQVLCEYILQSKIPFNFY